jgi:glycosyltransferase involved in cell wall biosynthesis
LRYVLPRLVDGLIVNSHATLATVRPGRTPVLVSPPAVELDRRDFRQPDPVTRRVVMLGRLSPWKGQDIFLKAFAEAFSGTMTEAYVVGGALFGEESYEASLRQLASELGIADRVHFEGHVTDPWAVLVDADVLVHASRIPEPFGLVVVQGLWARCAVVATRPGGPAEVVTDHVDGLLVPCGETRPLIEALVRLRDDPAMRDRLAENGRETARKYAAEETTPVMATWIDAVHSGRIARGSVARALEGSAVPGRE